MMLDMMTGEKIKTLAGHFGTVYCSVIHPLDQELYTGGSDTNILCWAPPPSKLKVISFNHFLIDFTYFLSIHDIV